MFRTSGGRDRAQLRSETADACLASSTKGTMPFVTENQAMMQDDATQKRLHPTAIRTILREPRSKSTNGMAYQMLTWGVDSGVLFIGIDNGNASSHSAPI